MIDTKAQHKPSSGSKNGSRIPIRRRSSSSAAHDDLDTLRQQVTDLEAQNQHLQNTLKATEETVHCQTQKMKTYRNMLVEHGLLSRSRSQSLPDVAEQQQGLTPSLGVNGGHHRSRKLSLDSVPQRFRSLSPGTRSTRSGSLSVDSFEVEKLNKENSKLRKQVDGYKKVLQVFQHSRSMSPNSDSDKSGLDVDGAPEPLSAESATCLAESWLDLLDKFFTDLNEPGHLELPTSAVEVSRLRRGLGQVRTALQTLTEAAQGTGLLTIKISFKQKRI